MVRETFTFLAPYFFDHYMIRKAGKQTHFVALWLGRRLYPQQVASLPSWGLLQAELLRGSTYVRVEDGESEAPTGLGM